MKSGPFLSVLCGAALLLATAGSAGATVKSAWFNSTDTAHKVVSGESVIVKAVCDNPAATTYEVKVGATLVDSGDVQTNPNTGERLTYAIASNPITVTAAQTFTVYVYDAAGLSLGSDTFAVQIVADTPAVRKEIAISDGLWWLHTQMGRSTIEAAHGHPAVPSSLSDQGWNEPGTIWVGQAFVDAGHLATGSANNPYVEDVQRVLNFVSNQLAIVSFTLNPKDGGLNPENRSKGTMIDKLGIYYRNGESEYGIGAALKFFATCGYTTQKPATWDDDLNFSGSTANSVKNWTFSQIVQQMVDFVAWAQLYQQANDYSDCLSYDANGSCSEWSTVPLAPRKRNTALVPGSRGGWPYFAEGWGADVADNQNAPRHGNGTFGDVSVTYWTVQGLMAAEAKGCYYPSYIKTDLATFLSARQDSATGEFPFGPAKFVHLVERAGAGLSMLKWVGVSATDARVTKARDFIAAKWTNHTYHHHMNPAEQGYICHDQNNKEVQCYSHFLADANPAGSWICDEGGQWPTYDEYGNLAQHGYDVNCKFEVIANYDDINILAFKNVAEGLKAYSFTTGDYANFYRTTLLKNQFENGSWDDHGWSNGSTMGTSWAISTLIKSL